jgi:hypothetical protein
LVDFNVTVVDLTAVRILGAFLLSVYFFFSTTFYVSDSTFLVVSKGNTIS